MTPRSWLLGKYMLPQRPVRCSVSPTALPAEIVYVVAEDEVLARAVVFTVFPHKTLLDNSRSGYYEEIWELCCEDRK